MTRPAAWGAGRGLAEEDDGDGGRADDRADGGAEEGAGEARLLRPEEGRDEAPGLRPEDGDDDGAAWAKAP